MLDPRYIPFDLWAGSFHESDPANVPVPPSEDAWRGWAAQIAASPGLLDRQLPDPFSFLFWSAWAEQVYGIMHA